MAAGNQPATAGMPPRVSMDLGGLEADCLRATAIWRMVRRADAVVAAASAAGATPVGGSSELAGALARGAPVLDEVREQVRHMVSDVVPALGPAGWTATSRAGALPQPVGNASPGQVLGDPSAGYHGLRPGHVIAPGHVIGALDGGRPVRAQSALARPGARLDALQQCDSLTQLVRCVVGHISGRVVGQLLRGIAVEKLAASAADVNELVHAFEDVPALVGLLPRRDQAAPGRLLMAQQRLLLVQLGEHGYLDYETVLATREYFEHHASLPRNWRRGWLDVRRLASVPKLAPTTTPVASGVSRAAAAPSDVEPEPETEGPSDEPLEDVRVVPAPEAKELHVHKRAAQAKLQLESVGDETPLRDQIVGVLGQVHPTLGISSASCTVMEDLLFGHVESQLIGSAWQRVRERLVEERLSQEAEVAHVAGASAPRGLGHMEMEVSEASLSCRCLIANS
eukprot:COSAG03_NODE_1626_length_3751_cov_2.605148_4_plen_454_part_00